MRPSERYQLTLTQLAEFDDLLTDSLVDRVYYWTTIRKMRTTYHPNRGVKTEAVVKIIVEDVVRNKALPAALQKFVELVGIRQYIAKLGRNEQLKSDFSKHARRYLSIYLPDAPFEVSATNRYNLNRLEACIIARRVIQRGETIKYLTGAMVKMSAKEEEAYTAGKTDFSIIYSSRVGGMSLLLGPARFVNHDCNPNAKFITSNKDNIQLNVVREIQCGEEITVSYADDYFGENNNECLCRTCEDQRRNGWAQEDEGVFESNLEESACETDGGQAMMRTRSKRKSAALEPMDLLPTDRRVKRKPNKLDILTPPVSDRATSEDAGTMTTVPIDVKLAPAPVTPTNFFIPQAAGNISATVPVSTNIDVEAETADIAESLLALAQSPGFHKPLQSPRNSHAGHFRRDSSGFGSSMQSASPTTTNVSVSRTITVKHEPRPESSEGEVSETITASSVAAINTQMFASANHTPPPFAEHSSQTESKAVESFGTSVVGLPQQTAGSTSDSELSEISESEFDRLDRVVGVRDPRTSSKPKPAPIKTEPVSKSHKKRKSITAFPDSPLRKRAPGDYLRPSSSEEIPANCHDCHENFIHNDRWYIPLTCRRCERHSKIYGLVWPKTVKKKGDDEDLIDDPRKVQRYITASEHRKQMKRIAETKQ